MKRNLKKYYLAMTNKTKGIRYTAASLFGGNSNNDGRVGTFYVNLNNPVSNTNWNYGAAHYILLLEQQWNVYLFPLHMEKINLK